MVLLYLDYIYLLDLISIIDAELVHFLEIRPNKDYINIGVYDSCIMPSWIKVDYCVSCACF